MVPNSLLMTLCQDNQKNSEIIATKFPFTTWSITKLRLLNRNSTILVSRSREMFKQVGLGGLTLAHLDLNKGNLLLIHKEKIYYELQFY